MKSKIFLKDIEDNLQYKTRINPPINNTGHLKVFNHNGAIELEIIYKNKILVTIIAERTYQNAIRVDVESNHKNIKKLNLAYRKTKINSTDKDFIFKNEIQLVAGPKIVKQMLFKTVETISKAFDFKPTKIITFRATGIGINSYSNNEIKKGLKDRVVNINLRNIK